VVSFLVGAWRGRVLDQQLTRQSLAAGEDHHDAAVPPQQLGVGAPTRRCTDPIEQLPIVAAADQGSDRYGVAAAPRPRAGRPTKI
jgi:hypothetical protein